MNPPLKFVAIAFSDYGGIGLEFYSAVVRPYFEGLREKEEEAGAAPLPEGFSAGFSPLRPRDSSIYTIADYRNKKTFRFFFAFCHLSSR